METEVQGHCADAFGRVREIFEEGFRGGREIGASVCVTLDGETVVDLWAGHADPDRTRPWTRDTIANVYSTTKGMTALCAWRLVDRGALDLDAPVARYWPGFAAAGKERIPVRWLLSHRAGLAALREPLPPEALYDWDAMCAALAAERPWWEPGSAHGYHALTFGWLVGEVVRRIDGRSLGTFFREEVAGPLGADLHIGLPDAEHARAADLTPLPQPEAGQGLDLVGILASDPEGLTARAFLNPPSMAFGPNHAAWRRAEIPGANGHANARAVARVYAALACGGELDGVRLLSPEAIERCRTEASHGEDRVLRISTRFGGGFMLSQDLPFASFGPDPAAGAFGHPGAGGSVGFADPAARLSFGYVMNRTGPHILLDPRADALIRAAYAGLG